ncbi:hypothetical protein [Pseudomonas syringae]|uniref:hypothetical protein n=1 Tax=Pseudomonas syringae TaxID=317 RepID=UPI000A818E8F|nr:hypothetical protein [Pseudomonas syringae]
MDELIAGAVAFIELPIAGAISVAAVAATEAVPNKANISEYTIDLRMKNSVTSLSDRNIAYAAVQKIVQPEGFRKKACVSFYYM